jgi:hypothetical protein
MDAKQLQGVAIFSGLQKKELEDLARWTDEVKVE